MKYLTILILSAMWLTGCNGWGDYYFESDRFDINVTFPHKWEVFDRSDDLHDFLEARIPEIDPYAIITVRAQSMAPDINANEIYPMFMEGSGDVAILNEFRITEKGMIPSKKAEGRFISYTYLTDKHRINGMRVLLLGFRVKVNVEMEMPEDNFHKHEREFREMIRNIEVKQL